MATVPAGPRPTPFARGLPRRRALRGPASDGLVDVLTRAIASGAVGAVVAAGAVLAARRCMGGFSSVAAGQSPGMAAGLAWMTLGGGLALLAVAGVARGSRPAVIGSIAARLGLVAGVSAVSLPASGGGWTSFLPVAAAAGIGLLPVPGRQPLGERRWRRRDRMVPPPPIGSPAVAADLPATAPAGAATGAPTGVSTSTTPRPPDVPGRLQQHVERYDADDGADCLRGHVRLSIPAGGRGTHAHVGFCPAFAAMPLVEVTTDYDGVEAVVSAAEVVPWGVRIECRLSEPAEEALEIPVDLLARLSRA